MNMLITYLGVLNKFTGKVDVYKLQHEGNQYRILDYGMNMRYHIYNGEKFEPHTFSDDEISEIKYLKQLCLKSDKELTDDLVLESFYPELIQKEIQEKRELERMDSLPKREEGELFYDEVNYLLDAIDIHIGENYGIIDEDICNEIGDNQLLGYKYDVKVEGDHRNDGQMVDYYFTFTSPEGKVTSFETEMCLMVGWNYHKSVIFE